MPVTPTVIYHSRVDEHAPAVARFWLAALFSILCHLLLVLLFLRCSINLATGNGNEPLAVNVCMIESDVPVPAQEPGRLAINTATPVPSVAPPPHETSPIVQAFIPDFARESQGSTGDGAKPPAGAGGAGAENSSGIRRAIFETTAPARRIVYVVDRSSSMGLNAALEKVKQGLVQSLARLPADAQFQVVLYNRRAEALAFVAAKGLVTATEFNKQQAAMQLQSVNPEGSTDHLAALRLALSFEPDVIYFLTDADDLTPAQVRTVTQLNRGRAAIHTIELTTANLNRLDMPLQVLARSNRGTYRVVSGEW